MSHDLIMDEAEAKEAVTLTPQQPGTNSRSTHAGMFSCTSVIVLPAKDPEPTGATPEYPSERKQVVAPATPSPEATAEMAGDVDRHYSRGRGR